MRRWIGRGSRVAAVGALGCGGLAVGAIMSSGQFGTIFFEQSAIIDLLGEIDAGESLQSIALVDVDEDGDSDLVVLDDVDSAFVVYESNGDGSFGDRDEFDLSDVSGTLLAVTAADVSSPFNSDTGGLPDGKVDLVVAAEFEVVIIPGLGDGDFAIDEVEIVDVDDLSDTGVLLLSAVETGLFDGDDVPDIVAKDEAAVVLLCNNGGSFGVCRAADDPVTLVEDVRGRLVDLGVGDFDGDTNTDVVVLERNDGGDTSGGAFYALFGNGDGTFALDDTRPFPTLDQESPRALAVANLDDDSADDVVICNFDRFSLDNIEVRFGARTRRDFPRSETAISEFESVDIQLADFDDDGLIDFAAAGYNQGGNGGSSVAAGTGFGGFGQPFGLPGLFARVAAIAVGDIDGDGLPDMAGLRRNGDQVAVVVNVSDVFLTPTAAPTATPRATAPSPTATPTMADTPATPAATNTAGATATRSATRPTATQTPKPRVSDDSCNIDPRAGSGWPWSGLAGVFAAALAGRRRRPLAGGAPR